MKTKLSLPQIEQILKASTDPHFFCEKFLTITSPTTGDVPFIPYPWQSEMFDSVAKERFNVIVKARQVGASTFERGLALHEVFFNPYRRVLVLNSRGVESKTFIDRTLAMYEAIPGFVTELNELVATTKTELIFKNGSSIKALSAESPSGCSEAVNLLIIDEAAFIENLFEVYKAFLPTISTGGRGLIVSTPSPSESNSYFEKVATGGMYKVTHLPCHANPNMTVERYEEWKKIMPPANIQAEVFGRFKGQKEDLIVLQSELDNMFSR